MEPAAKVLLTVMIIICHASILIITTSSNTEKSLYVRKHKLSTKYTAAVIGSITGYVILLSTCIFRMCLLPPSPRLGCSVSNLFLYRIQPKVDIPHICSDVPKQRVSLMTNQSLTDQVTEVT